MATRPGRFIWHDLMTIDLETSLVFLSEVLGFDVIEAELIEGMPYYMCAIPGTDDPVFGVVPIEPEEGQRSHWTAYLAVDSLDDTLSQLTEEGGIVHIEPEDVTPDPDSEDSEVLDRLAQLGSGRVAIVTDPQGAVFAPMEVAQRPEPPAGLVPPLHIAWHELFTRDIEGAAAFYQALAGWQVGPPVEREIEGTVRPLAHEGRVFGMVRPDLSGTPFPPHWGIYFRVEELDAVLGRLRDAGGAIYEDPAPLDAGRRAQILDPTGAPIGLWQAG